MNKKIYLKIYSTLSILFISMNYVLLFYYKTKREHSLYCL